MKKILLIFTIGIFASCEPVLAQTGFNNGFLCLDVFTFSTSSGNNNNVLVERSRVGITFTNANDTITGFTTGLDSLTENNVILFISNASLKPGWLKHNSSNSSAGNKIFSRTQSDILLMPGQTQQLGKFGGFWRPMSVPQPIPYGTTTRASSASSGNDTVRINAPVNIISFSAIDDADSTVLSDGTDNGTIAWCTHSNSVTLLATLISTNYKSQAESIFVQTALGAGWMAKIVAIAPTYFVLNYTKLGAGRNITIRYATIL